MVFHKGGANSCESCHRAKKKEGWNGPLKCTGCHLENADRATARAPSKAAPQSAAAPSAPAAQPTPRPTPAPVADPTPSTTSAPAITGAGPKVIKLHDGGFYPVKFDHHRHQSVYGIECSSCHHVPGTFKCRSCHTPKTKVSRKDAFHMHGAQSCQNCHKVGQKTGRKGPTQCNGCHKPR
jgi:hypothetical protein